MNKIDVSPLSNFECTQRIQNAESPIQLDDSLVCVKALDQSANMCMVDGGSPLACEREDGTYEIVGVYSRETGCQPTNQVLMPESTRDTSRAALSLFFFISFSKSKKERTFRQGRRRSGAAVAASPY